MKTFILLLSIVLCLSADAQNFQEEVLWSDNFSTDRNSWNTSENEYSASVNNGKLVCDMPIDGPWRWTYIGIPYEMSRKFNESEDGITLSMDYEYSIADEGDHFGFIFDLHNVDNQTCPGGDGYSLIFSVDHYQKTITPEFFGTQNCNNKTLNYIRGMPTQIKSTNSISIRKLGATWQIFVNHRLSLTLRINGYISIDRLKFGEGRYVFDNCKIKNKILTTESVPNLNDKGNKGLSADPTIYAVCVGINDYSRYEGVGISGLRSAVSDAESYVTFLKSINGLNVPANQILLLKDLNATKSKILKSINTHFGKARPNDLVILFISGHGGPNSFFCASDGPLQYKDINQMIETSTLATRKLILADACHSGNFATAKSTIGPRGKEYTREEALKIFYEELNKSNANITYLLASEPDEVSWEGLKNEEGTMIKGGTFTYYLIRGLSCEAKNPQKVEPIIYVDDIFKYMYDKITNVHHGQFYRDENNILVPVTIQHPVLSKNANPLMPVAPCNKVID